MFVRTLTVFCLLSACHTEEPDTADDPGDSADSAEPIDTGIPAVDGDGDGYSVEEDCDDGDPTIHPNAEEIPYDGIDQDCDEQDMADVDDDGFTAEEVGGEDCDDEDPSVFPGQEEIENGIDDDCDGEVDEQDHPSSGEWPALFEGANAEVYLQHIVTNSSGQLHALGHFDGKPDFDPAPDTDEKVSAEGSTEDIFIVKLDSSQALEWIAGLTTETTVIAHDLQVDPSDSVLVAGSYDNVLDFDMDIPTYVVQSNGGMDGFAGLYGSDGTLTWGLGFGGDGDDACNTIASMDGDSIWIGGRYTDNHDFDPGPGSADVRESPEGSFGGYVVRINSSGDYESHLVFTAHAEEEEGKFEEEEEEGEDHTAEVLLVSPTENGLTIVGRYGGTIDMDPSEDGIMEMTSSSEGDLFVVHLNEDDEFEWAVGIASDDDIEPTSLHRGTDGSLVLAGHFSGTVDFDTGESETMTTSSGDVDGFVLVLDETGATTAIETIGGAGTTRILGFEIDSDGGIYWVGSLTDSFEFGEITVPHLASSDCMVGFLGSDSVSPWMYTVASSGDDSCAAIALVEEEGRLYTGGWVTEDTDFESAGWEYQHLSKGVVDAWILYTTPEGP